jgi:hypothetical protein
MKSHKTLKKILLSIFFVSLLINISYPVTLKAAIGDPLTFEPQVGIPGLWGAQEVITLKNNDTSYIANMVKGFYNYGIGIAGILAAIMLMAGGLIWLTSAGSSDKITQAKNLMSGSVIGLVILFGSWMLLRTINPALVDFRITIIDTIEKITYGCCEFRDLGEKKAQSISSKDCKDKNGEFYEPNEKGIYLAQVNQCTLFYVGCNISIDCDGNVNWCHDSDKKITTKQTCGLEVKTLYEFKDTRCNNLAECNGKRVNCFNITDGEKCEPDRELEGWWTRNIFTKSWGYCYDSMCHLGYGLEAERCGSKPGAYCSHLTCSDLGQTNEKYYRDNSSGRKCSTNLYCCYKE